MGSGDNHRHTLCDTLFWEPDLSIYGGMFCPPICPQCFMGLHGEHAKPGAPPCPRCGHKHPEGLTFEDYQRAKAEWNAPKCCRCGLSVDERAKYFEDPLCASCSRDAGRIVELNTDMGANDHSDSTFSTQTHAIRIAYTYGICAHHGDSDPIGEHTLTVDGATFSRIQAGSFTRVEGQSLNMEDGAQLSGDWLFNDPEGTAALLLEDGEHYEATGIWLDGVLMRRPVPRTDE